MVDETIQNALKQLRNMMFEEFTIPAAKALIIIFSIVLAPMLVTLLIRKIKYASSSYAKSTGYSFRSVIGDLGKKGEYLTYSKINSNQAQNLHTKGLFNLYVPKKDGTFSEIDAVYISNSGIFVVESKNYSGWIFGNETDTNWVQTLPQGNGVPAQKTQFYNPIKQNQTHISVLRDIIGDTYSIFSLIVFSERCTLKNINYSSKDVKVIKRDSLNSAMLELSAKSQRIHSEAEIEALYNKLLPFTHVSKEVQDAHIEQVYAAKTAASHSSGIYKNSTVPNSAEPLLCPLCGKKLVMRTAKKGANAGKQFYGCSGYPNCRYIRNL